MNEFKLTEEQKRRIEQNRLEALEKLRNRQERLARENAVMINADAPSRGSLALTSQTSTNSTSTPAAGEVRPTEWWKRNSVPVSNVRQVATAPAQAQQASQKAKARVVLQLDSPTTFSASACAAINSIYRSITGSCYVAAEQLWKFPLSQYEHLCKSVSH